jgi:uncharacterized phage infection (PIP) family protein YhgE
MTNVFKPAALAAVIGGALALGPTTPAAAFPAPQDNKTPPTSAELKKTLDETNNKLAELQTEVKRLANLLEGKPDDRGIRTLADMGVVGAVKDLKNSLEALDKTVKRLNTTEVQRPAAADATAGKGTVRLVNDYPVRVSILVNDRSYQVEPRSKEDVTVPAGKFTYQLLANGVAAVESTIKEKEVVTLRIK